MRRGHLDELPQLINVIKGEMSLVGPRPERPEIISKLQKTFPDFHKRLIVRPGITGLAQLRNGYDKSIEGLRLKLDRDLEYIETRSWKTDFLLILETLPKFYDKSAH
jgi:lipopolysaccharide/colanic/teichoic acid biosynthesis glycosyltransferase